VGGGGEGSEFKLAIIISNLVIWFVVVLACFFCCRWRKSDDPRIMKEEVE